MGKEKSLIILDSTLKRGFTPVPNAVLFAPDLSMAAKCLYAVLLAFAWQEDECFPGQERLAEACGCTDRTVRKYLDELREYGLVSWVRRGLTMTNIYYIHDISRVERLKALKIKDRKERSDRDRKELSDKEYSDQYNVVVVDPDPNYEISDNKAASTVESDNAALNAALLPARESDAEKLEEEIREKVREAAGADISPGFAKEIAGKYPLEKIHSAIAEMKRQIERGAEIRGVGAWLRSALIGDFQPDQPARVVSKPEKRKSGNNTASKYRGRPGGRPKAMPETSYTRTPEEERKRKELLRSLYV